MIKKILINGAGSAGIRHFGIARNLFPNAEIAILTTRQMLDSNLGYNWHFTKVEEAIKFQPDIAILPSKNTPSRHLRHEKSISMFEDSFCSYNGHFFWT